MKLSAEAQELLDLRPDPASIVEALEGVEIVLAGFRWDGCRWILTEPVQRIIGTTEPSAAFSRFVIVRDDLRSVLVQLRHENL